MRVYEYVSRYVRMCLLMSLCKCVYVHYVYICIYIYVCIYIYLCIYICIYIYIYIHMYLYIYR